MKDWEYNQICRRLDTLLGIDLRCYKPEQMQRRLSSYLLRSGHENWPLLLRSIQHSPTALEHLRNYLTIHVSSFFRDPEKYATLQNEILPNLLKTKRSLRIWSAGCALGQEPYSLAMLLDDECGSAAQFHITATDIDKTALTHARAGGPYLSEEIRALSPRYVLRYFEQRSNNWWMTDALRRQISFRRHNLLEEPINQQFDLIVCRNVTIYFTEQAKNKVYGSFASALRPGGILFVGSSEVMTHARSLGFEFIGHTLYRRLPNLLSRRAAE